MKTLPRALWTPALATVAALALFLGESRAGLALLTGEQMDSVREVLIGNPFGTGWDRIAPDE